MALVCYCVDNLAIAKNEMRVDRCHYFKKWGRFQLYPKIGLNRLKTAFIIGFLAVISTTDMVYITPISGRIFFGLFPTLSTWRKKKTFGANQPQEYPDCYTYISI
jgi:hypothetical protein